MKPLSAVALLHGALSGVALTGAFVAWGFAWSVVVFLVSFLDWLAIDAILTRALSSSSTARST